MASGKREHCCLVSFAHDTWTQQLQIYVPRKHATLEDHENWARETDVACRERERAKGAILYSVTLAKERESHFGSGRPAAVLLVRGALGDGPPGGQRVVSASLAGGRSPEWGEA